MLQHHETLRQQLERCKSREDWLILQNRLNLCTCTKRSTFSAYQIDDAFLLYAVRLESPKAFIEFLLKKMHHVVVKEDYYSHFVYNAILPKTSGGVMSAFLEAGKKVHPKLMKNNDYEFHMLQHARSLLDRAISTPNVEIVDLLLSKFPNLLTAENNRGNLPLHEACTHCKCCNVVKTTLKHMHQVYEQRSAVDALQGFPAFLENESGKTSLQLASNCLQQTQSKTVLSLLLETLPPLTVEMIESHNLLHLAAQTDNVLLAKKLLAIHPNSVHLIDYLDNLALHIACFYGSSQVLNLLLGQSGRNQSLDNNCCCLTPLHLACMNSAVSCNTVQQMLGYHFQTMADDGMEEKKDDDCVERVSMIKKIIVDKKLLHFCAQGANVEVASTLIDLNPSSIYIPDNLGKLPIHIACERGSSLMVQLLLQRGLKMDFQDSFTTGGLFRDQNRPEIPCRFQPETVIHLACLNKNMTKDSMIQLLDAARITEEEIQRWGLLHLAARGGNVHVASVLVDRCPQYLMQEDNYEPIQWACYNTQPSMIRFLLQKGDTYQYNFLRNRSPLHILIEKFGKKRRQYQEFYSTDNGEGENDKIWECIEAYLESKFLTDDQKNSLWPLLNDLITTKNETSIYSQSFTADEAINRHITMMILQLEAIRILPSHTLELAIERFGNTQHVFKVSDLIGETSLHVLADVQQYKSGNWKAIIQRLLDLDGKCARNCAEIYDKEGQLPLHLATKNGLKFANGLSDIVDANPSALNVTDNMSGMYPFMLAAVNENNDLETTFELLRKNPVALRTGEA